MSARTAAVILGLATYAFLLLAIHGLHRLATPLGREYLLWFSSAEVLLKAIVAFGPGLVAGWMTRVHVVSAGAVVGAVGGISELMVSFVLAGMPLGAISGRLALAALPSLMASVITNAVGAAAGAQFRALRSPSNRLMQPTGQERPAADQER